MACKSSFSSVSAECVKAGEAIASSSIHHQFFVHFSSISRHTFCPKNSCHSILGSSIRSRLRSGCSRDPCSFGRAPHLSSCFFGDMAWGMKSSDFHFRLQSSREVVGSDAEQKVASREEFADPRVDGEADSASESSIVSEGYFRSTESEALEDESAGKFISEVEQPKSEEGASSAFLAGSEGIVDTLVLISPFFLWGTAMVAMKGLLPRAGPMFVASARLIPAGFLLVGYGAVTGKKQPGGLMGWLSIALFALVDATCFQGFLVEGLKRTSAGLGSVIIDSQPLTVAILAALLFGEKLGLTNYLGIGLGISGLLLLEIPFDALQSLTSATEPTHGSSTLENTAAWVNGFASWEGGEWRMLVAAQSMAVGTVMIRWVCKYTDPFMATGWHMVLGGLPLLVISVVQHEPAVSGHIQGLTAADWLALLYTSVAGSAISYGVFFYNATRGSLTKLSSLTFLTPVFAALFGFLLLGETLSPLQCLGGAVTLGGVLLVNYKPRRELQVQDGEDKSL